MIDATELEGQLATHDPGTVVSIVAEIGNARDDLEIDAGETLVFVDQVGAIDLGFPGAVLGLDVLQLNIGTEVMIVARFDDRVQRREPG